MALSVTLTGTTVTLDETTGLQNDDTSTALPTAFSSRLTALGADPATAINAAVSSGNVISISGATGSIGNIAFTDANGGALDGDTSGLFTNDGEEIFLFTDTANDNIVLGKTALGAIAFAVYLEETGSPTSGGKFWSIQYEALEHPNATNPDDSIDLDSHLKVSVSEAINFSFAGAPSGSNLFMMFGDPASTQIVVIGRDPLDQSAGGNITTKDVLNISQAGSTTSFGVNGNQINPGEGAFITYVTGANTNFLVPNLDQNEADVEANIAFTNVVNASSASFTVNQTNPGVGPVSVKISALNTAAEPGVNFVNGLTNDTAVSITSVSVVDNIVKTGNTQFTPTVTDNGDGTWTIKGLSTGDKVSWTTSGTHDRVLIENVSNADGVSGNDNNTFDIGGFSLSSPNAASAVVGTAVHFEDDGPLNNAAVVNVNVDEDELTGLSTGNTDNDATTTVAAFTGAQIAGLVNAGADQPVTVSLNPLIDNVDTGLDSKGSNILFDYVDATHVNGVAGGRTVFTLVQTAGTDTVLGTADDAFTFTLLDQVDHVPLATGGGDAETIALSLASVFVATDGDGDSVVIDAGASVTIENDVPQNNAATVNVNVDEDELTGLSTGITDNDATTTVAAFTGAQIAGLVNAGADEPVTVSLNPLIDNVDTGLDSKGSNILFDYVDATHVNGVAGARTVFTLVQTAGIDTVLGTADDAFTFTLLDQVDHVPLATGGGDAETIALSLASVFAATDFDGDSVVIDAGASVTIENDVPTIGLIDDGLVDFAAGSTVTKTLSGVVGADEPATYSITSSPASLTILDGTSSQVTLLRDLTNSNTVATYFKDVDGSTTHNAGDIDFFKLTLSGGNYTFDVLQNPPPAELNFSFAGAPSGSNLFMTFGDPASAQIVVIGQDPLNQSQGGNITTKDVLNISQAGSTTSFGVNGNQINPDEGAFITYVTGANTSFLVPNLDQNEADVEANIAFTGVFNTTSASFTVNQTNPGVGPVTVKITAFSTAAEPGVNFVDGLTNDTAVSITSVSVVDNIVKTGNTQFTPVATPNGDGTWTITGLSTGDKVSWTTSGTHDRVLIENVSNADGISGNDNNTFDIGGFGLSQAQPAPDEKLDFTVQIADFDGDTASDIFSMGIDGTGIFNDNHVEGVIA